MWFELHSFLFHMNLYHSHQNGLFCKLVHLELVVTAFI